MDKENCSSKSENHSKELSGKRNYIIEENTKKTVLRSKNF